MYAKLVRGVVEPGEVDAAARAVRQELIPLFESYPGACAGHWMADRATGEVLIATTWDDASALAQSRSADGAGRSRVAERIGLRILSAQTMEVIAEHDVGSTHGTVHQWVRTTWVEGLAGDDEASYGPLHAAVVEDQSRSDGFRGSCWMADRLTGDGLALSFWDGPTDLSASSRGSARRRRRLAGELGFRTGALRQYEALGVVVGRTPYASSRAIAYSGQLSAARRAFSTSSAGTSPVTRRMA